MDSNLRELVDLAVAARDAAYAPYSKHPVGAAIRTKSGRVFTGCNVENAAFPLGNCAEQAAIAAMVLEGERVIDEIVVVGPGENPCTPCGGCRQRIREFAGPDVKVHACSEKEVLLTMTLGELLPESFGPDNVL